MGIMDVGSLENGFNTNNIRSCVHEWTLDHDVSLLKYLQHFSERLLDGSGTIIKSIEDLESDISSLFLNIKTISQKFQSLADKQFIEHRVEDDANDVIQEKVVEKDEVPNSSEIFLQDALSSCLQALHSNYEDIVIKDESPHDDEYSQILVTPVSWYQDRMLPPFIGTEEFVSHFGNKNHSFDDSIPQTHPPSSLSDIQSMQDSASMCSSNICLEEEVTIIPKPALMDTQNTETPNTEHLASHCNGRTLFQEDEQNFHRDENYSDNKPSLFDDSDSDDMFSSSNKRESIASRNIFGKIIDAEKVISYPKSLEKDGLFENEENKEECVDDDASKPNNFGSNNLLNDVSPIHSEEKKDLEKVNSVSQLKETNNSYPEQIFPSLPSGNNENKIIGLNKVLPDFEKKELKPTSLLSTLKVPSKDFKDFTLFSDSGSSDDELFGAFKRPSKNLFHNKGSSLELSSDEAEQTDKAVNVSSVRKKKSSVIKPGDIKPVAVKNYADHTKESSENINNVLCGESVNSKVNRESTDSKEKKEISNTKENRNSTKTAEKKEITNTKENRQITNTIEKKEITNTVENIESNDKEKKSKITKRKENEESINTKENSEGKDYSNDDLNSFPTAQTTLLESLSKARPKITSRRRPPSRWKKNKPIEKSGQAAFLERNTVDSLNAKTSLLSPSTDEEDLFSVPASGIPRESSLNFFKRSLLSPGSSLDDNDLYKNESKYANENQDTKIKIQDIADNKVVNHTFPTNDAVANTEFAVTSSNTVQAKISSADKNNSIFGYADEDDDLFSPSVMNKSTLGSKQGKYPDLFNKSLFGDSDVDDDDLFVDKNMKHVESSFGKNEDNKTKSPNKSLSLKANKVSLENDEFIDPLSAFEQKFD